MSRPTVAVVAVHGVADQAPNSSAEAIAGLLLEHGGGGSAYTAAHEIMLHIPTRRAVVTDSGTGSRPRTFFDDKRPRADPALSRSGSHEPNAAPDHQLMRAQLGEYKGSDQPYRTVRLETQRLDSRGRPEIDVHVYEMYWADLSRLGTGVLRFFSELYQLLFHSANLGRQTLDYAAIEHDHEGLWSGLSGFHRWAVRMLTVVIPVVALVILAIGSTPVVLAAPRQWQTPAAIAMLGAAIALILGLWRYRRGAPANLAWWTLGWVLGIIVLAVFARWALTRSETRLSFLLVVEWLLVAGLFLLLVLRAYDRYRPGALKVGMGLYLLAVAALGATLLPALTGPSTGGLTLATVRVTRGVLWTVEGLWFLGLGAWVALCFFGLMSWVLGAFAVRRARRGSARAKNDDEPAAIADRAARAVRTSRLTLALPAAAFMLVTTILWYAVVGATEAMVRRSALAPILEAPHCPLLLSGCTTVHDFLRALLWNITTIGLPLAALLLALGLSLLGWWLVPIAATEVRPPPEDKQAPELSDRMGKWLSTGVAYALVWIGRLVAIAFVVVIAAYVVSALTSEASSVQEGGPQTITRRLFSMVAAAGVLARGAIELVGGFLVAGAVGVLALRRGRLEALSRPIRPILDVVLDVDGYLREHPRERTSRARIAERYVSLLRYLCAWRNPDAPHEPYSAIVILAHSQGTVISTDLLGFVRREHDPALDPIVDDARSAGGGPTIATYLFTMGSPLRQLYEQFFPHLYSWVTRRPAAWGHADLVDPMAAGPAGSARDELSRNPDPTGLRVSRWVNAYRSGDYVGRYLWLPEGAPHRFRPGARSWDSQRRRCDLCVGAGAHTHYWDSRLIARELDALIGEGAISRP